MRKFALKISALRTRTLPVRADHVEWTENIPVDNPALYIREKLVDYLADNKLQVGIVDGLVIDLIIELYNALPEVFYMCSPNGSIESVNGLRINRKGYDELEQASKLFYQNENAVSELIGEIGEIREAFLLLLNTEDNQQIRGTISHFTESIDRLAHNLEEGVRNYKSYCQLADPENYTFEHCLGWVDSDLLHLQITNPMQYTSQIMSMLITKIRKMGILTLVRLHSVEEWKEKLGITES